MSFTDEAVLDLALMERNNAGVAEKPREPQVKPRQTSPPIVAVHPSKPHLRGLPSPLVKFLFVPAFLLLNSLLGQLLESGLPLFAGTLFITAFIFRYYRLVVHIVSYLLVKPISVREKPTITPRDVTVIVPTVGPDNPDFFECIESICANKPQELRIVVSSSDLISVAEKACQPIRHKYDVKITVSTASIANKRKQMVHALQSVTTEIVVFADDHVFWPPRFLRAALAPFEDSRVATVGTVKRVRRTQKSSIIENISNMLGCLYLERHNFDILSTNNLDGGVFVVSGRTVLHRAAILQNDGFYDLFTNEHFFFGKFGLFNADDDNCVYRYMVRHGYDVVIQSGPDATMETTLGDSQKFPNQCLRWVRTTWRSNLASLITDRTVWRRQLWCVYSVHLTSLVNFALFYDAIMLLSLWYTVCELDQCKVYMAALLGVIFCSKMVKSMPYFVREPRDLVFLPVYILFGYYHSLIKLYAGLTFWETSWGSRKNVQ